MDQVHWGEQAQHSKPQRRAGREQGSGDEPQAQGDRQHIDSTEYRDGRERLLESTWIRKPLGLQQRRERAEIRPHLRRFEMGPRRVFLIHNRLLFRTFDNLHEKVPGKQELPVQDARAQLRQHQDERRILACIHVHRDRNA